jgi:hypothetical protein
MTPKLLYALAWPIAAVGMCAAVAYATVKASSKKTPEIACIEQHGRWVSGGAGMSGTCEFACASTADKLDKSGVPLRGM